MDALYLYVSYLPVSNNRVNGWGGVPKSQINHWSHASSLSIAIVTNGDVHQVLENWGVIMLITWNHQRLSRITAKSIFCNGTLTPDSSRRWFHADVCTPFRSTATNGNETNWLSAKTWVPMAAAARQMSRNRISFSIGWRVVDTTMDMNFQLLYIRINGPREFPPLENVVPIRILSWNHFSSNTRM